MTDEQKKKPGRDIGGIRQFATFGGDDEETDDLESQQSTTPAIKQSGKPQSQRTKKPNIPITRNSDSQISSNLDSQMVQYPESQVSGSPESQITGKQDMKMVSYQRKKRPERKAQIAYLPPDLIKWLRVQAAQEDREISEIVADALELYRKQQP